MKYEFISSLGLDTLNIYKKFKGSDDALNKEYNNAYQLLKQYFNDDNLVNTKFGKAHIGNIENLRVELYSHGVVIVGSISIYAINNNFYSLTLEETINVLKKLSLACGFDVFDCIVRRFDFGCCLIMECSPEKYFEILGDSSRIQRKQTEGWTTLYYETDDRVFCIYDKIKQAKKKKWKIYNEFKNHHVLRNEIRYKDIKAQFGRTLLVKDLLEINFYQNLTERWWKAYDNIEKINSTTILHKGLTFNQAKEYFSFKGFNAYGKNKIYGEIANDKLLMRSAIHKTKLRKWLKKINSYGVEHNLTSELNEKMLQAKNNTVRKIYNCDLN